MSNAQQSPATRPHVSRAFTLVEILVVLAIIAVLAGLLVTVGGQVSNSGRKQLVSSTMKILDTSLNAWMQQKGQPLPPGVEYYHANTVAGSIPVVNKMAFADAYVVDASGQAVLIPTVSWFIKLVDEVDACASAADEIKAINPKLISFENTDPAFQPSNAAMMSWRNYSKVPGRMYKVVDPWGNPLRMVHPAIDGNFGSMPTSPTTGFVPLTGATGVLTLADSAATNARYFPSQVNRYCMTDADRQQYPQLKGYGDGGKCIEGRPYFYSVGADGDPSRRDDNVYLTTPRFVN